MALDNWNKVQLVSMGTMCGRMGRDQIKRIWDFILSTTGNHRRAFSRGRTGSDLYMYTDDLSYVLSFLICKKKGLNQSSGSQSIVPRSATSVSPENMWKHTLSGLIQDLLDQKIWGWDPASCVLLSLAGRLWYTLKFETHWTQQSQIFLSGRKFNVSKSFLMQVTS